MSIKSFLKMYLSISTIFVSYSDLIFYVHNIRLLVAISIIFLITKIRKIIDKLQFLEKKMVPVSHIFLI